MTSSSQSADGLSIGLGLSDAPVDIFGDACLAGAARPPLDDENGAPTTCIVGFGGASRKAPKAKAKGKAKAEGAKPKKKKECRFCHRMTDDWSGKKTGCRLCMNDIEAAERDARAQGELELFKELKENDASLGEFLREWVSSVGPSRGSGNRRGGFGFARYKQVYMTQRGKKSTKGSVMLTHPAFIKHMMDKGETLEWAKAEWTRRQLDPKWKKGIDGDTRKPTTQVFKADEELEYEDRARADVVEFETKTIKNPKRKDAEALLEGLGDDYGTSDVAETLEQGRFLDLATDFACPATRGPGKEEESFSVGSFLAKRKSPASVVHSVTSDADQASTDAPQETSPPSCRKRPRTDKFWDPVSNGMDMRGKLRAELSGVQTQLEGLLNSMRDALATSDEWVNRDRSVFGERVALLKKRCFSLGFDLLLPALR